MLLGLVLTGVGHAEFEENDIVKNGMVVLEGQKYEPVALAWKYQGNAQVDYEKVRKDEAYAEQISALYDERPETAPKNYLVNTNGEVLASLASEGSWDVFYRTASANFGKKAYTILDSADAGATVLLNEGYWNTFKLVFYKRTADNAYATVTKLEPLKDINLERVDPLYRAYLDKTYAKDALYQDAKEDLAYTYNVEALLSKKLAQQADVDYALLVSLYAAVPKGAKEFEHREQKIVGIKVKENGKTELVVLDLLVRKIGQ